MGYGKDDELAINTIRLLAVSRSSLHIHSILPLFEVSIAIEFHIRSP